MPDWDRPLALPIFLCDAYRRDLLRDALTVDVEPKREAAGESDLYLLLQHMETRRLDIAEEPLEVRAPVERCASCDLQSLLDRVHERLPHDRPPCHHCARRLGAWRCGFD